MTEMFEWQLLSVLSPVAAEENPLWALVAEEDSGEQTKASP